MERTGHAWQAMVRDLYRVFEKADEERELIRDIDSSIIHAREVGARPVEDVLTDSLDALSRIYDLRVPGLCYVYVGPELLLLEPQVNTFDRPARLDTSDIIRRLAAQRHEGTQVLSRDETADGLFHQLSEANTILLHPIYAYPGELFCVMLFADANPSEGSRLSDPDFHNSLRTVAQQLCIAYEHRLRADQDIKTTELWELFLSSHLAPTRCFYDLAHTVRTAFPTFGPLQVDVLPEVQILTVPDVDSPHFLTIRGTTGSEAPMITKIDVADSIVGLLVEHSDDDLPFFYDDPRKEEYAGRYKSYLGLDGHEPIRTEYALRLRMPDGRFVGILNIESHAADAFNIHHRNAILQFASQITPMVDVFEQRIEHNSIMHRSVISTTSVYLESLAGIFRHGIGTPLLALNLNLGAVRRIIQSTIRAELQPVLTGDDSEAARHVAVIDEELNRVDTVVSKVQNLEKQIGGFAEDFAKDISGFSLIGRFDLRRVIEEIVSLARRSILKDEENITIEVEGEERADAFCSSLLKQHMYSLLTNSIYSLQPQLRSPASPGIIKVILERDSPPDESQELDLNKRWVIRVRDNGGGVDEDQLARLREFRAATRFRDSPGQGLGLLAVQRYMSSIGGWISLDSKPGDYFEVKLLVDEYREDIHGPYSTTGEGALDGAGRD